MGVAKLTDGIGVKSEGEIRGFFRCAQNDRQEQAKAKARARTKAKTKAKTGVLSLRSE